MAEPPELDTAPEVTFQRDGRLGPAIRLPAAIGCHGVAAAVERVTAQLAASDEDPVRIACGPLLVCSGLPTVEILAS